MKNFKRILSVVLSLMFVLSVCVTGVVSAETTENTTPPSFDATKPYIKGSASSVKVGETVEVTFELGNNPGFWGMRQVFSYDKDLLSLVEGTTDATYGAFPKFEAGSKFSNSLISPISNEDLVFLFTSVFNKTSIETNKSNGTLFKVWFKVADDATSGTYDAINLKDYSSMNVISISGQPVEFTYQMPQIVVYEKDLLEEYFTIDTSDKIYTGEEIKPDITTELVEGVDYDVEYLNNIDAGIGTIVITGKGDYGGSITKEFKINPLEIVDADFDIDTTDKAFTNSAIKPSVVAKTGLVFGSDYVVSYENNVIVGEASITVTGIGNYSGIIEKKFTINVKELTEDDFSIVESMEYTGVEVTPSFSTVFSEEDYDAVVSDNIIPGTASVVITGKNNLSGTIVKTFEITTRTLTENDFDTTDVLSYTGEALTPEVSSSLLAEDYEIEYVDNVNIGLATVNITGKRYCVGTVSLTFEIVEKAIEESDFTFDLSDKTYTGKAITPSVTTSNLSETDYEVTYKDNIDVGTATVTVTGKGNCAGTIEKTFVINKASIKSTYFTIDTKSKYYTGKAIKPSVKAKIGKGNYTVTYSNNTKVGTATVKVTGKGNYKGTVSKNFKIVKPKVSKVTSLKAKSTAKKKLTVSWKKVSGVSGYKITYSLNKSFKKGSKYGTKTVYVKASAKSKVLTKLKSGKKYYVKVEAYKTYTQTGKKGTLKTYGSAVKIKNPAKVK